MVAQLSFTYVRASYRCTHNNQSVHLDIQETLSLRLCKNITVEWSAFIEIVRLSRYKHRANLSFFPTKSEITLLKSISLWL